MSATTAFFSYPAPVFPFPAHNVFILPIITCNSGKKGSGQWDMPYCLRLNDDNGVPVVGSLHGVPGRCQSSMSCCIISQLSPYIPNSFQVFHAESSAERVIVFDGWWSKNYPKEL